MSRLALAWTEWLNAALGLFYPEICQLCRVHRATPAEGFVCDACRKKVRFIDPPFCNRCGTPFEGQITASFECGNCSQRTFYFSRARSAAVAGEVVMEAVHRYKYQRALWFEPFLAEVLCCRAASDLAGGKWDWIVPVPLHATKLREREFNQARSLAVRLSEATGIPVHNHLLKRVLPTQTQTRLTRQERAENVRHAFALCRPTKLPGVRGVVVDDIFTTGATTGACARVLKTAGASDVCVWTVARGI